MEILLFSFQMFIASVVPIGIVGYIMYSIFDERRRDREAVVAVGAFGALHGLSRFGQDVSYQGLLPGNVTAAAVGVDKDTQRSAEIFHYVHIIQGSKSRKVYQRTVIGLSIKPTHQHIFVNSRLNDVTEQMPGGKYVRYQAEGQFSKYFDIYTPHGKQVHALSLFAPDLMAHLMAEFGQYDIEILDSKLYVYAYSRLDKQSVMEKFYQLVNALAVEIDSNAPRKVTLNQAVGPPEPSAITTMHANRMVQMIRTVLLIVALQIIFLGLGFVYGIQGYGFFQLYLMPMIMLIFILTVIVRQLSHNRLNKHYEKDRQQFLDHLRESDSR